MKKFFVLIMFLMLTVKSAESLPERYDLRDYGRITSVKNQGKLAACGTFASLGAMESNYLTQGLGKATDLSEMHLVYYGYGHSGTMTEKSFTPTYSSETFATVAFCARLAGPALEQNMKYSDKLKSVGRSAAKKLPEDYKRPMRLREAYFLSSYDPYDAIDIDTRKKLIMKHGAIVVGYYSDIKKYHRTENYYTYFNNSQRRTHEVLLAGWDDNFSRDNFNPKPKNNGAWLVKNSWGTDWGDKGYFWMSYEQMLYGGTAFIVEKDNPKLKHYGYDDLGYCNTLKCTWGANIFKIEGKSESLKEAAFYTTHNDTACEISVYDLGDSSPASPVSGKLISGVKYTAEIAGYHTVNLPEVIPMKEGQFFSIILNVNRGTIPVEAKRNRHSENAVANKGESYFSENGTSWEDGITIIGGSNACIKAFTITK
ncbi:MAG: hypothetical protein IJU07_05465 [Synergistaceae bacterium]|nr:hypothetical protein [Synergistaceae bacterium]